MQRSRDWRRAQRERAIARVESWMKDAAWWYRFDTDAERHKAATIRSSKRKDCSCWMCGNPRTKLKAVTTQEIIFDDICRDVAKEEGIRMKVPNKKKDQ